MKVTIKSANFKLTKEIKDFVQKQIDSLEKFAKDILKKEYYTHFLTKDKPKVEAWVEIGKVTKHHKKGPYFLAECQIRFPGKSIRAESLKEDFKSAIIEVREELKRQIKTYKEKAISKLKRGARKAKVNLLLSEAAKKKERKRILREGI